MVGGFDAVKPNPGLVIVTEVTNPEETLPNPIFINLAKKSTSIQYSVSVLELFQFQFSD